jgi:hypothetical protein
MGWIEKGKVGKDLTVEQGYQATREVGLNLLADDARCSREPRQGQAGGKGFRDGKLCSGVRRATQSHQRMFRSVDRGVW